MTMLLPPGAAHISRMDSPGVAPRAIAVSMLVLSMKYGLMSPSGLALSSSGESSASLRHSHLMPYWLL